MKKNIFYIPLCSLLIFFSNFTMQQTEESRVISDTKTIYLTKNAEGNHTQPSTQLIGSPCDQQSFGVKFDLACSTVSILTNMYNKALKSESKKEIIKNLIHIGQSFELSLSPKIGNFLCKPKYALCRERLQTRHINLLLMLSENHITSPDASLHFLRKITSLYSTIDESHYHKILEIIKKVESNQEQIAIQILLLMKKTSKTIDKKKQLRKCKTTNKLQNKRRSAKVSKD